MINWKLIDTIFLDMDGTLPDLYYDNFIWEIAIPQEYMKQRGIMLKQADLLIKKLIDKHRGTLNAYCLKYWSKLLNINLLNLHYKHRDKIKFRDGAEEFLNKLQKQNLNVFLVTNADDDNLKLKLSITCLNKHVKEIYSAHKLGYAKEQQEFWLKLQDKIQFSKNSSILIDDNKHVLSAAQKFGLGDLFLIDKPCSMTKRINSAEYKIVKDFKQLFSNSS